MLPYKWDLSWPDRSPSQPPKSALIITALLEGVSTPGEEEEGCLSLTGPLFGELRELGRQKGKT